MKIKIRLTESEARNGCKQDFNIKGKTYRVSIPVGCSVGTVLRIRDGNNEIAQIEVGEIVPDATISDEFFTTDQITADKNRQRDKNSRAGIFKKILVGVIAFAVAYALGRFVVAPALGGSGQESGGASGQTPAPTGEIDISSGLTERMDGDNKILETDWFTITLPAGDTWSYDYNPDSGWLELFTLSSRYTGEQGTAGGSLVFIHAVDPETDTTYKEWSQYWEFGTVGDKLIVGNFPSDVQWNQNSKTAEEEYLYLDNITRASPDWFRLK